MAYSVTHALTGISRVLLPRYDEGGNVAPAGRAQNDASALIDTQQTALDAFLAAHNLTNPEERAA